MRSGERCLALTAGSWLIATGLSRLARSVFRSAIWLLPGGLLAFWGRGGCPARGGQSGALRPVETVHILTVARRAA